MTSGVVKSVVLFLLLAVFSLVAGSMVADSAKEAIIPALLVGGIGALLWLGKNCWWLIFIVPPIITAFGFMPNMPVGYAAGGVVMVYWVMLSMLGHTRLTWNGVKHLDIVTLVLFLFFISTWFRNPVTIEYFSSIYDEGYADFGGSVYVWCVASVVFYVSLSIIPLKLEFVIKILKVAFWLSFVVTFFLGIKAILTPASESLAITPVGKEDLRSSPLMSSGISLAHFLFSRFAIVGILLSPWKLILIIASFAAVAKSGFRSEILKLMIFAGISNFFHRQFVLLFILMACAWGAIVCMSQTRVFDDMPFGMQRSLSAVPGIQLGNESAESAVENANATMDWRYQLWDMGWNPKSGYIKDYMCGDGFAISQEFIKRQSLLIHRGDIVYGDLHNFAVSGLWHHGTLSVVHRTGWVGVFILGIWMLFFIGAAFRLCISFRNTIGKEYVYIHAIPLIQIPILFFWTPYEWLHVFRIIIYEATLVKVIYSVAVRDGFIHSLFAKRTYVPLIQQPSNSILA